MTGALRRHFYAPYIARCARHFPTPMVGTPMPRLAFLRGPKEVAHAAGESCARTQRPVTPLSAAKRASDAAMRLDGDDPTRPPSARAYHDAFDFAGAAFSRLGYWLVTRRAAPADIDIAMALVRPFIITTIDMTSHWLEMLAIATARHGLDTPPSFASPSTSSHLRWPPRRALIHRQPPTLASPHCMMFSFRCHAIAFSPR